MLAFFRSLGGLLGVTGSGAILAHQLHQHGVHAIATAGAHGAAAAPAVQGAAVDVYRHAIANIFGAGALIVLLGLVALLFLPELPLANAPAAPPREQ
jgi:hypothetical protein